MFRLYLSHLQALKIQIHTVNEKYIVGSPTLTGQLKTLQLPKDSAHSVGYITRTSYVRRGKW
jgi:hypothetical protein